MSTRKGSRASKGVKLKRWATEEIQFLQARFDIPFSRVFREFKKAGYKRTERASSVKFYALKKAAGETRPKNHGDGDQKTIIELAEKYDVVTLQAAVEIREVLERLA